MKIIKKKFVAHKIYSKMFDLLYLYLVKKQITPVFLFSFQNPCQSAPCKNGATCVPNYRHGVFICKCKEGFIGEYCQLGIFQL